MKHISPLFLLLFTIIFAYGQEWQPAGNKIKTTWAETINPQQVLPEYPRPILERSQWQNLNGLWDYAILDKGKLEPAQYDGKILVPFCVESSLSGVQKTLTEKQELWYHRTFTVPSNWNGKHIMLNFGAIDWKADIYVNDILIGTHTGGYTAFSFDITPYLNAKGAQKLVVRVWDPSNKGYQPIGKQTLSPGSIWYTAVSGIWQTVWLEPVGENHITNITSAADIKNGSLELTVRSAKEQEGCLVEATLLDGNKVISKAKGVANGTLRLAVPDAKLWSPEQPFLYNLKLTLTKNGKPIDEVQSYAAMRTITAERDYSTGYIRLCLNGKSYFQYGPLDQGWFPDGLYTAPCEEAMLYDLKTTKDFGFNMIRKHVKVEPDRWYYLCDREGILVWQDMPSGDYGNQWDPWSFNGGTDRNRTQQSYDNYFKEWKEIIDQCGQHPCVVVWVPFNEAWGQFETEKVASWTKNYDPTRLVNAASGGNHTDFGDIFDLHHYPQPTMFLNHPNKANVLGEYGGIGLPLEGHLWKEDQNWGYVKFQTIDDVTKQYVDYAGMLEKLVEKGYGAAVYTQTSDVEGEVNGLMTYDRKVIKMDVQRVREANLKVRAKGTEN